MSYELPPDSPQRERAVRFGAELRKAMKARDVGARTIAVRLGYGRTNIVHWLKGSTLPRLEKAQVLAEALDWPLLKDLVIEARTYSCESCGNDFSVNTGGPARYCSSRCQRVAEKRRAGRPTRQRADIAERQAKAAFEEIALIQVAVNRMCKDCEPLGICHLASCALRPVSPLRLSGPHPVPVRPVTPLPGPYGSPENRSKTIAAVRAFLERRWADPVARREQSRRTRAFHAAMSDEERADWKARVQAGRLARKAS